MAEDRAFLRPMISIFHPMRLTVAHYMGWLQFRAAVVQQFLA
ncbi:MAG: hypothetical protein ACHP8A_02790 [Terriglobales bacterium]|nr:hypothetical protein [Terriglobales bacterium]